MSEFGELRVPAELQDGINHVANYGPKALTYVDLVGAGDLSATASGIDQSMSEHIGVKARYDRTLKNFVRQGFAESCMAKSDYSSRQVAWYRADRVDDALPAIGTTLGWAADHGLPLKPFLGMTNARNPRKEQRRGPMNSLHILTAILNGESLIDSTRNREEEIFPVNRIEEMLKDGIIEFDDEINEFIIDDPEYRGTTPIERVASEVAVVYEALAYAKQKRSNGSWNVADILQIAKERRPDEVNDEWSEKVRKNIRRAAYSTKTQSFNGAVYKKEYVPGAYQINPDYCDAIYDLVHRVVLLAESSTDERARLADQAVEIFEDTDLARAIARRDFAQNKRHSLSAS